MLLCLQRMRFNYFITRVRITWVLARPLRFERRQIVLETSMLPLHQDHISGASWNRTTMFPPSTGCSRTISAKAPGSLYEDRTHPTGSKDQRPNQLGEQTILRMKKDSNFQPFP